MRMPRAPSARTGAASPADGLFAVATPRWWELQPVEALALQHLASVESVESEPAAARAVHLSVDGYSSLWQLAMLPLAQGTQQLLLLPTAVNAEEQQQQQRLQSVAKALAAQPPVRQLAGQPAWQLAVLPSPGPVPFEAALLESMQHGRLALCYGSAAAAQQEAYCRMLQQCLLDFRLQALDAQGRGQGTQQLQLHVGSTADHGAGSPNEQQKQQHKKQHPTPVPAPAEVLSSSPQQQTSAHALAAPAPSALWLSEGPRCSQLELQTVATGAGLRLAAVSAPQFPGLCCYVALREEGGSGAPAAARQAALALLAQASTMPL